MIDRVFKKLKEMLRVMKAGVAFVVMLGFVVPTISLSQEQDPHFDVFSEDSYPSAFQCAN